MKKVIFSILLVLSIALNSIAQLTFYPEDPMMDPPTAECITNPYFWFNNPEGSTTKCINEAFTRNALFNDPDNLGQIYWVNGITNQVINTGQTLNCSGLTQTTVIHCEYRIPTGYTCSGKYVVDYTVNIQNCTTPIDESIVKTDISFVKISETEYKILTDGTEGSIRLIDSKGAVSVYMTIQSSGKEYILVENIPGVYIAQIEYNGKFKTVKLVF